VGLPELAADVAAGIAVAEAVLVLVLACGVAVADDPQANNKATNNKTIALGQCFIICLPNLDSDILPSPKITFCSSFPQT
jgi:hypothetical protein